MPIPPAERQLQRTASSLAASPITLPFEPVKISAPNNFTAWQLLGGYRGALRSSTRLAIVAHPEVSMTIDMVETKSRVCNLNLHRALADAGWSILAYYPHEGESVEAACEWQVAALSYAKAHHDFKYCSIALLCQGYGAHMACSALCRNLTSIVDESNLRAISLFAPMSESMEEFADDFARCRDAMAIAVAFQPSERPLVDGLLARSTPASLDEASREAVAVNEEEAAVSDAMETRMEEAAVNGFPDEPPRAADSAPPASDASSHRPPKLMLLELDETHPSSLEEPCLGRFPKQLQQVLAFLEERVAVDSSRERVRQAIREVRPRGWI